MMYQDQYLLVASSDFGGSFILAARGEKAIAEVRRAATLDPTKLRGLDTDQMPDWRCFSFWQGTIFESATGEVAWKGGWSLAYVRDFQLFDFPVPRGLPGGAP